MQDALQHHSVEFKDQAAEQSYFESVNNKAIDKVEADHKEEVKRLVQLQQQQKVV